MHSDPAATAHSRMRLSDSSSFTTSSVCTGSTNRANSRICCFASLSRYPSHSNLPQHAQRLPDDGFRHGYLNVSIKRHVQEPLSHALEFKGRNVDVRIEGDPHLPATPLTARLCD